MCLSITHPHFKDIEDWFDKVNECEYLLLIQKEKRDELRHRFFRLLAVCHHRHHKHHHKTSVHVHLHSSHSGMMGGGGECCCMYEGSTLPESITSSHSGFSNIDIYGTSCSAWDSMVGTPGSDDCPPGADFTSTQYSSCARPWCYVSDGCSQGEGSHIFQSLRYSYDICGDYHSENLDDRRKQIKMIVQQVMSDASGGTFEISVLIAKLNSELGGDWRATEDTAVWSKSKASMWYLVKIPSSDGQDSKLLYIYPAS